MLDVVHGRCHRPFANGNDALLHVVGHQATVRPHNTHDRDIYIRKNVLWGYYGRDRTQNKDKDRKDHECIWSA